MYIRDYTARIRDEAAYIRSETAARYPCVKRDNSVITVCHPCRSDKIGLWSLDDAPLSETHQTAWTAKWPCKKTGPWTAKNLRKTVYSTTRATVLRSHKCEIAIRRRPICRHWWCSHAKCRPDSIRNYCSSFSLYSLISFSLLPFLSISSFKLRYFLRPCPADCQKAAAVQSINRQV